MNNPSELGGQEYEIIFQWYTRANEMFFFPPFPHNGPALPCLGGILGGGFLIRASSEERKKEKKKHKSVLPLPLTTISKGVNGGKIFVWMNYM